MRQMERPRQRVAGRSRAAGEERDDNEGGEEHSAHLLVVHRAGWRGSAIDGARSVWDGRAVTDVLAAGALPGVDDFTRRYAELAVRVGANVQPGQKVFVLGAPENAPLVRAVLAAAWEAGAGDVEAIYVDEIELLLRATYADEPVLDGCAVSRLLTWNWMLDAEAAEIYVYGDVCPELWQSVDGARAARVFRPKAAMPVRQRLINEKRLAWTVVGPPSESWARRVFGTPDVDRLRDAISAAVRLDAPDPVAAWRERLDELGERSALLTERRFDAVRFRGPGTDLTVGLLGGASWVGGAAETRWGQRHCVNLPTEEVFTTPDRRRAEGRVRTTRPVSYGGTLLDEVELVFEAGRARLVAAASGGDFVAGELAKDANAPYLGEVALVDGDSPVGRSGLLYYHPLYDENVASHIAYGTAYTVPVPGTDGLPDEALLERGINVSTVHTDLPIGGSEVEVVGLAPGGTATPIVQGDDWVLR
jgi:aminopeptidase